MIALYTAGALLVLAQIVGLYGLKTRKADLIFSVVMAALVVAAVVIGGYEAVHHLRNR
jgi:hypothetical protein